MHGHTHSYLFSAFILWLLVKPYSNLLTALRMRQLMIFFLFSLSILYAEDVLAVYFRKLKPAHDVKLWMVSSKRK